MATQLEWILVAVPVEKKLIAGKSISKQTGNPADDDTFTGGYWAEDREWAVACCTDAAMFDAVIHEHPEAKIAKWADGESSTEQELDKLGLSRKAT